MQKLLVLTATALVAMGVGSAIAVHKPVPSLSGPARPTATLSFEGLAAMP